MLSKKTIRTYEVIVSELSKINTFEARQVLLLAQKALFEGTITCYQSPVRRLSMIESDREVYEFLLGLDLEFMTQRDVFELCKSKFGENRLPKKSSFNRGFKKLLAQKALHNQGDKNGR